MKVYKYIKKPVIIEAIQFTGLNFSDINDFVGTKNFLYGLDGIYIHTLEGDMLVSAGDFVIKGVRGEFYPCKPDIFKETYDQLN